MVVNEFVEVRNYGSTEAAGTGIALEKNVKSIKMKSTAHPRPKFRAQSYVIAKKKKKKNFTARQRIL